MHPRLSLKNITKRYPGIVANDGINMDIAPGEVLAVLGENGAGKSTLMKIIYGSVRPDEGSLEFDGRPLDVSSPAEARASGIAMVHQHFALFDTLTVAENVALGLPPGRSTAEISEEVKTLGEKYGLEVDPAAVVYELSMGERQRVEIIRALMTNPKLLILDEPTSVLVPQAVRKLFVTLHRLAEEGVSILFISHKLDEIRELADRCVVLRAGRIVSSVNPKAETEASLARLMIGAEPPAIREASGTPGEVVFEMKDVSYPGSLRVCGIENVSVAVRKGEIVGVAGISGNGQARLMAVAAGEAPVADEGVMLFGKPVGSLGTRDRRRLGLRYVPEQRLGHAAVPEISLQTNTYLTGDDLVKHGFMLIVNQPTWGVDVGAAATIRNALMRLREDGAAVLVVSEEVDELFEICDRIAVMYRGHLSPAVPKSEMNIEIVGRWMSGLWPDGPAGASGHEGGEA